MSKHFSGAGDNPDAGYAGDNVSGTTGVNISEQMCDTSGPGLSGVYVGDRLPQSGGGGGTADYFHGGAGGGGVQSPPPKSKFSFNRFIVEPYISTREVKTATTGRTEFARIEQKVSVKALRLLVDVMLDGGQQASIALDGVSQSGPVTIKAGSYVFIREELLHTQGWAKNVLESEYLGKFIIVDKQHIEFIQPA